MIQGASQWRRARRHVAEHNARLLSMPPLTAAPISISCRAASRAGESGGGEGGGDEGGGDGDGGKRGAERLLVRRAGRWRSREDIERVVVSPRHTHVDHGVRDTAAAAERSSSGTASKEERLQSDPPMRVGKAKTSTFQPRLPFLSGLSYA